MNQERCTCAERDDGLCPVCKCKRHGCNNVKADGARYCNMPAHEGDEVIEDDKDVHLFVVRVDDNGVGLAYSPGGTQAVHATLTDFPIYFTVQ